jgi:hypothetical protein
MLHSWMGTELFEFILSDSHLKVRAIHIVKQYCYVLTSTLRELIMKCFVETQVRTLLSVAFILFAAAPGCRLGSGGALVQNSITIENNLSPVSPCQNGNTVTVFTADGGQQTINPKKTGTITGDYTSLPGLGIQVNNWYWTQTALSIQAGPPQNPDNSGAQFTVSDSCTLTSSPAWYGKGIETYDIATVAAYKSTTGQCVIAIDENQPYTDAVTPGCCAPPLPGAENVCAGPWGVTNNGQSWPPP